MAEQVVHLDATKPLVRVAMILALGLALLGSWFVVRWYVANTLAEYQSADENGLEMVRRAVSWAPSDPLTHWRLGAIAQRQLLPDQLHQVVNEYEKAASLSPNDYRFWMALGTALEQWGEVERGEKALRRATELSPSYAYPRWYLGNLLLRSGRYDQAFAELRRAADADPDLRSQLLNLAWAIYNKNLDSFVEAVGNSADARAESAAYLVGRQKFEDGTLLWQRLADSEKRRNRANGEAIVGVLVAARRFHQAVEIANDLVPAAAYRAGVEKFVDGGFEDDLMPQTSAVFGWQVKSVRQAQVGIDPNRGHSSTRSLRIVFQVPSRLDSVSVSQLVPVRPQTDYDFECYVKSGDLQSASTPRIEIADATDGRVVTGSESAPTGSADWQRIAFSFKTGPKTEAVTVRIIRTSCGEDPVCPIFGTVWYDDFNFKRRS
ncbi:MAG: tetratricopeptide repeat protein [Pyrinomonadaceae bacterium]|nr:tetratricopeptide repeat protein [Pyrinomonadaceae bacterium]MDQ3174522.1 tetratricopeptide repeat protein [Acidobacteriota bacterium]